MFMPSHQPTDMSLRESSGKYLTDRFHIVYFYLPTVLSLSNQIFQFFNYEENLKCGSIELWESEVSYNKSSEQKGD